MVTLQHLFVLSSPTQTLITEGPPDGDLEVPPYSLLEVIPSEDGSEISKIQCVYMFGMQDSDSLYRAYDEPKISEMIANGDASCMSLLDKIVYCIKEDTDSDDDSSQQEMVNEFIAGIVITMFAYCMAKYDPADVGNPYYPIDIILPNEARAVDSETVLLTESMYDHYSHGAKIVLYSGLASIGSQWSKQIISFWDTWGHCFNVGSAYDCSESMYRAITSCIQYMITNDNQHTLKSNIAKCLENHASTQISRICDAKEKFGDSVSGMIDDYTNKLQNLYVEMSTELEDIKSSAYEDVTRQSEAAMGMIEDRSRDAKGKMCKDQDAVVSKMKHELSVYSENLKSDLNTIIRDIVETKVKSYVNEAMCRIDTSGMYTKRLLSLESRIKALESRNS